MEDIHYEDNYDITPEARHGLFLNDVSVAVSPTGEKAVGFTHGSSSRGGSGTAYQILVDDGSGWVEVFAGGEICYFDDPVCALDYLAQDIAYDQTGNLYAMFTRERYVGTYPDVDAEQSISLARRGEAAWEEETLWDNTLYDGQIYYQPPVALALPHLMMTGDSKARILYNHYNDGLYLDYLAQW